MKSKIALVGLNKTALHQHLPTLEQNKYFELAATINCAETLNGIDNFNSLEDMIANRPDIHSISVCVPPKTQFETAKTALNAGLNVILEKPHGSTLTEMQSLSDIASLNSCSLFTMWRYKFAAGVAVAKEKLKSENILAIKVTCKEDSRKLPPEHDWIWRPGGLGVFDRGINAISLLTEILPEKFYLSVGVLHASENLPQIPFAADLYFKTTSGVNASMLFEISQNNQDIWEIEIETDQGKLVFSDRGDTVRLNGIALPSTDNGSLHDQFYDQFYTLLNSNSSEVDSTPITHVADCFMLCRHVTSDPSEPRKIALA